MTESPFAVVNTILSEPSNLADVLRIIARDQLGMKPTDRTALRESAEHLENAQRAVAALYAQLAEANQRADAASERARQLQPAAPSLLATTGHCGVAYFSYGYGVK